MKAEKRVEVAIVMILRGGRVLIRRRLPDGAFASYWEFPGGKCEAGESAESCATREAREELGVDVKLTQRWAPLDYDYPDRCVRLHPFLGSILSGAPRPLGCSEIRWVETSALPSYSFPEANLPLLGRLWRQSG